MLKCKCENTDWRDGLSWLLLFVLFVVEYFFFRRYVLDWVSPYYPANHDQAGYLELAYTLHADIASDGSFSAGVKRLLGWFFVPSPQGKLFPVLANLSFMLMGEASRYAALLPNFFSFLALQAVVFYVLKRAYSSLSAAFVAVGFLLALYYPFYWAGSLFDFRMDFIAFTVFGIWAALCVGSAAFASRRWMIAATLVAVVLVLLRHVTLVYIGIIYFVLLIFLIARATFSRRLERKQLSLKRLLNLVLSGLGILAATAPVLYASRAAIIDYYLVRHFTGVDKLRALEEMMAKGKLAYLMYYPNSVIEHLGTAGLSILALLVAMAAFFFIFAERKGQEKVASLPAYDVENIIFLSFSIIVPLVIYTIDISKTPVVAGIVLSPIVMLVTIVLHRAAAPIEAGRAAFAVAAVIVFLAGLDSHVASYREPYYLSTRHNNAAITEMYMDMGDLAFKRGLDKPLVGYDRMADYFTDATVTDVYYERGGGLLKIKMPVKSVEAITLERAIEYYRAVDFVVFSNRNAGRSGYPFDGAMDENRPALAKLLAEEFTLVKTYNFNKTEYGLYWNSTKASGARISG